jgi:glycosyltransferase involved in cell wall biosynthesis
VTAGRTPARADVRVVALIDTVEVSGPGRQLAALAVALREHGVELRVAMFRRVGRPHPPYAAHLDRLGIDHTVIDERGPLDRDAAGAVGELLARWRPDVVQTHSYKMTAVAALLRARGAGWAWAAFFHGATTEDLKVRVYHWLDRRLMGRADRIVVMSQTQLDAFRGTARARARVVYNAVVPMPVSEPAVDLAPFRVPGAPLLAVVGRLSSEKGVDLFLDACARLAASGQPFTAVLAGDGPDRAALEARRTQLGLDGRVHFLGVVRNVDALYRQVDLLVLPSRSEGLPNVLLEALQRDVPVVSTVVGAVPEVVGASAAATLVPPGAAGPLADAIALAIARLDDPEARRARAEVAARFSLAHRVSEHLRLYGELLGGPGRRAPARAPGAAAPAGAAP